MPELPEVETIRNGIIPWVLNYYIEQIDVRNYNLRFLVPIQVSSLKHELVLDIKRRGKYLLLKLCPGWIIIHFGMSGSFKVLLKECPVGVHDHIDLIMSNGSIIRYTDPRRFGFWLWAEDIDNNIFLQRLGQEPLDVYFNYIWLFNKSRNVRCLIKVWLMDSKIIAGIGNIYVNESLFIAGILPNRLVCSLKMFEVVRLVDSIKYVLSAAIYSGGTSLRNFVQVNGTDGYFTHKLKVYNRAGKPCFACNNLIKKVKYRERSTFFCICCQS